MSIIKTHNIILETALKEFRLELLPMTDDHLPLLYEWNKKPDILYWCEGDDVVTNEPDDVNGIYGSISQKAYMFIIRVNGTYIGDCWLQEMNLERLINKNPQKNIKRIDITIYEESLWNKGLGRTINSMLLNFGFQNCNADLIYAITEDYNLRAQKCILKSGFIIDEKLEHHQTSKGKYEFCYMISKENYEAILQNKHFQ